MEGRKPHMASVSAAAKILGSAKKLQAKVIAQKCKGTVQKSVSRCRRLYFNDSSEFKDSIPLMKAAQRKPAAKRRRVAKKSPVTSEQCSLKALDTVCDANSLSGSLLPGGRADIRTCNSSTHGVDSDPTCHQISGSDHDDIISSHKELEVSCSTLSSRVCPSCSKELDPYTYATHLGMCLRSQFGLHRPCGVTGSLGDRGSSGMNSHSADETASDNSGYVSCQLCQQDLSHLDPCRHNLHLNRCVEESETIKALDEERRQEIEAARKMVLGCPICGKALQTNQSRLNHLKKCGLVQGVSVGQILSAVKTQVKGHQATLDAGLLPYSSNQSCKPFPSRYKKPPISRLEEDTQLAMALSSSLTEQVESSLPHASTSPVARKRAARVSRADDCLLTKLSVQQAAARVEDRVCTLLTQTRWYGEVDDTHFPSAGNHFMEGDVTMAVIRSRSHQLGRQMYWELSSLEPSVGVMGGMDDSVSPEEGAIAQFYVPALMPPVQFSCVAAGSKIRRMSDMPGRCGTQNTVLPEDASTSADQSATLGLDSAAVLPSQTAAVLASLAAKADDLSWEPATYSSAADSTEADLFSSDGHLGGKEALSDYLTLVNQERTSDVRITSSGSVVLFAHSLILSVRCPKLLEVYRSSDMDIDLSEFSPLAVLAVLKFVYAGHISTIGDGLQDVLMLAERLGLTHLVGTCHQILFNLDADSHGGSSLSSLRHNVASPTTLIAGVGNGVDNGQVVGSCDSSDDGHYVACSTPDVTSTVSAQKPESAGDIFCNTCHREDVTSDVIGYAVRATPSGHSDLMHACDVSGNGSTEAVLSSDEHLLCGGSVGSCCGATAYRSSQVCLDDEWCLSPRVSGSNDTNVSMRIYPSTPMDGKFARRRDECGRNIGTIDESHSLNLSETGVVASLTKIVPKCSVVDEREALQAVSNNNESLYSRYEFHAPMVCSSSSTGMHNCSNDTNSSTGLPEESDFSPGQCNESSIRVRLDLVHVQCHPTTAPDLSATSLTTSIGTNDCCNEQIVTNLTNGISRPSRQAIHGAWTRPMASYMTSAGMVRDDADVAVATVGLTESDENDDCVENVDESSIDFTANDTGSCITLSVSGVEGGQWMKHTTEVMSDDDGNDFKLTHLQMPSEAACAGSVPYSSNVSGIVDVMEDVSFLSTSLDMFGPSPTCQRQIEVGSSNHAQLLCGSEIISLRKEWTTHVDGHSAQGVGHSPQNVGHISHGVEDTPGGIAHVLMEPSVEVEHDDDEMCAENDSVSKHRDFDQAPSQQAPSVSASSGSTMHMLAKSQDEESGYCSSNVNHGYASVHLPCTDKKLCWNGQSIVSRVHGGGSSLRGASHLTRSMPNQHQFYDSGILSPSNLFQTTTEAAALCSTECLHPNYDDKQIYRNDLDDCIAFVDLTEDGHSEIPHAVELDIIAEHECVVGGRDYDLPALNSVMCAGSPAASPRVSSSYDKDLIHHDPMEELDADEVWDGFDGIDEFNPDIVMSPVQLPLANDESVELQCPQSDSSILHSSCNSLLQFSCHQHETRVNSLTVETTNTEFKALPEFIVNPNCDTLDINEKSVTPCDAVIEASSTCVLNRMDVSNAVGLLDAESLRMNADCLQPGSGKLNPDIGHIGNLSLHEAFHRQTPQLETRREVHGKRVFIPPSPFSPMPQYDKMDTPMLKAEMQNYGLKQVSKKRMRLGLKDIYHRTHLYETDSDYEMETEADGYQAHSPVSVVAQSSLNFGPTFLLPSQSKCISERGGRCSKILELGLTNESLSVHNIDKKKLSKRKRISARGCCESLACVEQSGSKIVASCDASGDPIASAGDKYDFLVNPVALPSDRLTPSPHNPFTGDSLPSSQDSDLSDSVDTSVLDVGYIQADSDEDAPTRLVTSQDYKKKLMHFLRSNSAIHHKILTYEPLDIASLKAEMKSAGICCSQEKLIDFLYEKCVTFTTKNMPGNKRGKPRNVRSRKARHA